MTQGDFGVLRLLQIEEKESRMLAELERLVEQRAAIQNKVDRLSSNGIDFDLLDEYARKAHSLAAREELVIRLPESAISRR